MDRSDTACPSSLSVIFDRTDDHRVYRRPDGQPDGTHWTSATLRVTDSTMKYAILGSGNVGTGSQVRGYVDAAVVEFDTIEGFFNNAGIEGKHNLTGSFGTDEFDRVLSINLNGVFYGMAAVLEAMREQGHGAIVNTTSVEVSA